MPCQNPRLLILDNGLNPKIYNPTEHWRRYASGASVASFRTPEGFQPEDPEEYTHAIVTGSEASINQDDAWIEETAETVRRLAGAGVPILASCFGHQLVVRALSGRDRVRRSSTPEFGWVPLIWNEDLRRDDPLAGGLPSPAWVYAAHFDEVFGMEGDWETLATTPGCAQAVIRRRNGPVWGFQHHPEIEPPEARALFRDLQQALPDRRAVMERSWHGEERDSFISPSLMRGFLSVGVS